MDIDQTRKRLLSLVATGKERGIAIQYDSPQNILPKLAEKDSWPLKEILPVLLGTTHATVEIATLVAQRSPECGLYKAMILSNIDNSYQNIVLPALEQAIPSGRLIFFTYFLIQYATLYDLVRGAVDAQILPALTRYGEIVVFPTTFIPWAQGKGYIVPRTLRNITTPCNIRKTPEEYLMILHEQGIVDIKAQAQRIDEYFSGKERLSDAKLGALLPANEGATVGYHAKRSRGQRLRGKKK